MDTREFLKGVEGFRRLADEHIDLLVPLAKVRQVDAGTMIDVQGDPAERFYILVQGRVVVVLATDFGVSRNSYIVTSLGPGEMFAWSGMVGNLKYTAGGEAMTDVTVLEFNVAELEKAFEADPELGYHFMRSVARTVSSRLRHMQLQFVKQAAIRESVE
ncbi:MAG TPA: Crp/Fnr family transcriptional regulator [candidate division WOR-3 bacterium]|mgnify:CR=1 FL=1|uniref:Crp/Fnr family transcriptional regulator n=1 Tax=candidate division WOR-3 bacterium TaxID=2052148 RepID=A0A7V0XFW2_UNCW3|nr:Crp/Fnr family transcriptional regulator [candidate division WOR-3 bacterium]